MISFRRDDNNRENDCSFFTILYFIFALGDKISDSSTCLIQAFYSLLLSLLVNRSSATSVTKRDRARILLSIKNSRQLNRRKTKKNFRVGQRNTIKNFAAAQSVEELIIYF